MRRAVRDVVTVLAKDLTVELRTREVLLSMGLFALLEVVIFSFAFYTNEDRARAYAPGIIWISILFAASLGLGRLFDRERESSCFEGNLLTPMNPLVLYTAKLVGSVLFTLVMEVLAVPLVFLFFSLTVDSVLTFVAVLALGTVGFVAIQTLFAAALAASRMRELLIPLVVYPLVVPLIVSGVKATGALVAGQVDSSTVEWIQFMVGYDILFVPLSGWLFARVAELG